MVTTIRSAHLDNDRSVMLALLREHLPDWHDDRKFDWLYSPKSFGRPRVWLIADENRVVGLSSAFPRVLRAGSRTLAAWVLGDFCVAKDHRSLGPAILLQRAVCEGVDRGEVDLWYDFPSSTMLAIYKRMRLTTAGELVRMVYPLRVDRVVAKKIGSHLLTKGVSTLGNVALRSRDASRRRDTSVDVTCYDREFELQPPVTSEGIYLDHTPDYLNWRYRRDPRGLVTVFLASKEDRKKGFIAFRRVGEDVTILDAFGMQDEAILRELVLEVLELARKESATSVTIGISDQHPWKRVFEDIGFHARDSVPFVVYARPGVLDSTTPWFLMSGDRD